MKGVLLLGGSGSRLFPLNEVCNKHLINVGGKPMAQWNVEKFVDAGIFDILIITGKEHMGSIVSYFGSGSEFGCNFTYKVQEEAGGIADAIKLVKGFVEDDEQFYVILGDNIFEDELATEEFTYLFEIQLYATEVDDPERFGVFNLDNTITEKPKNPETNKIVCGIYGYRYNENFRKVLYGLKKSKRGELEVTDLNNGIIEKGNLSLIVMDGYWTDAGTHESLKLANKYKYEV